MAVPTYEECMFPFLKAIKDGKQHHIKDIIRSVSNYFELSEEDLNQQIKSGGRLINNRVGWARTYLKKAGLIESPERGMQLITEAGKEALKTNPIPLNTAYLKENYSSFQEWHKKSTENARNKPDVIDDAVTPEETIGQAYEQLTEKVASDLLDLLKNVSPYFFEDIVVRVLQAMGYGGLKGKSIVTPKSSDGGIDGVIYEDKLGLDVVCIQAKRWQGVVGRKVVQEFAGSMDLYKGKKGVIITTSTYSKDALEFVNKIEGKKVVLIDGEELAKLMIDHKVGVSVTKSYDLVDISQDFFDDGT